MMCASINPAAADNHVAIVEDGGLAGGDCRLRLVELELGTVIVDRPHTASRRTMAMPNLNRRGHPRSGRLSRNPVHALTP